MVDLCCYQKEAVVAVLVVSRGGTNPEWRRAELVLCRTEAG